MHTQSEVCQQVVELLAASDEAMLVGVGGFPFMGKTRLVTAVAASDAGRTRLLPVEAFVLTRGERAVHGLDGCDPKSYEIDHLVAVLGAVSRGEVVQLREYSWERGERTNTTWQLGLESGGALLVDGTVCVVPKVAACLSFNFFFRPANYEVWLRRAIQRDVAVRHWSSEEAEAQNRKKYETTSALFEKFSRGITHHYSVHMTEPEFSFERLE